MWIVEYALYILKDQKLSVLCSICFIHNIGEVSGRLWHDSLSMYYIDKESCNRQPETPPILTIQHVSKKRSEADFLVIHLME